MTIVILALYINQFLSIRKTACIVAIPSIMRGVAGFLTPKILKKIPIKYLNYIAIYLNVVVYLLLPNVKLFWLLLLLAFFNGIAEMLYQPIIKYLFSNIASTIDETRFVHKMRYYSICIAGLIGPLLGGIINKCFGAKVCFYLAAGIELFILVLIFFFKLDIDYSETENNIKLSSAIRDKVFLCFIISGFLVYFVFSQFETVYSLALKENFNNTEIVYSILLCLNSLFGIILQTLLLKLNKLLSVTRGIVFFIIAFVIFAFSFFYNLGLISFIIGVLIYTIGEVTVIPGLDIQIDEYATGSNKMNYFALAEFRTIGFVLGPAFLGWALDCFSSSFVCIISIVILIISQAINLFPQFFDKKSFINKNQKFF